MAKKTLAELWEAEEKAGKLFDIIWWTLVCCSTAIGIAIIITLIS